MSIKLKGGAFMFVCKPIEKRSKNGDTYVCLEITFPNGYTKLVFLDKAEQYLTTVFND